jgi:hypothetical protein
VAYRKTILSVMADFYMEELEERMLQWMICKPLCCFCCVDDTALISPHWTR